MNEGIATPEESDRLHSLIKETPPKVEAASPINDVSPPAELLPTPDLAPDSIEDNTKRSLNDYTATSKYEVSEDIERYAATPPPDPYARDDWEKKTRATAGRDIAKEGARQAYENIEEQSKNVFIGILSQEIVKINDQSTTDWFNKSIGTPEGESNLLGDFYDYVINNPEASSDLVDFYRTHSLIKDSTYEQILTAPAVIDKITASRSPLLAEALIQDPASPMGSHIISYLATRNIYGSANESATRESIMAFSRKHLQKYRDQVELSDNQVRNVRLQLLSSLGQFGNADTNYVLTSMDPSVIADIKRTPTLKSVPVEAYLEALMVTPAEISSPQNYAKLQEKWGRLGLAPSQMSTLRHMLINGPQSTASPVIQEIANDANNEVDAQNAILEYLKQLEGQYEFAGKTWPPNGVLALPDYLKNEFLTDEFLLSHGMEPMDRRAFPKRWLSGAWGGITDGIKWAIGQDEKVADSLAKAAFSDPEFSVHGAQGRGLVMDPFKEEIQRRVITQYSPFVPLMEDYRTGLSGASKEQLTARYEAAVESGASKQTLAAIKLWQGGTWVEHAFIGTAMAFTDGIYENFVKRAPNWASRGFIPSDKLPTFEDLYWKAERLKEYAGMPTVIDRYPELKKYNLLTSYDTVRQEMVREDSRDGGAIRLELTRIYLKTEYPERNQLEDSIAGLLELDLDKNNKFYMANALEFIALYNEGMSAPEALDEALTAGMRMRAGFQMGVTNILDVGSLGTKTVITGAIRSARGTTMLRSGAKEAIGALQIIKDAGKLDMGDAKLVGQVVEDLDKRTSILQNQIDNGIDTVIVKQDKRLDQVVKQADLVLLDRPVRYKLGPTLRLINNMKGKLTVTADQLPDLTKTQKELNDLVELRLKILKAAEPEVSVFGVAKKKGILELDGFGHLGDAITRTDQFLKQGGNVKDIFKIEGVLKRKLKVASMNVDDLDNFHGQHEVVTSKDFLNPFSKMQAAVTGANWDGPVRDAITRRSYSVVNEMSSMIGALLPRFQSTDEFARQALVRDMLQSIIEIGGKKDVADPYENLQWLVNSKVDDVLYQETQKALALLKGMDLSNIKSLLPENNVGEKISTGKWWAGFNEEMKTEVTRLMFLKYGMDPDNAKMYLKIQNGMNSFISKLYLERPAFAARNWLTNKTLMALDGLSMGEIFLSQEQYHKRVWADVEFAAKAFSKAALGETLSGSIPIRGETNWYKVAIGLKNEKILASSGAKRLFLFGKGGGYPFVGGGLPFIHARELSGLAESTDRVRIIDKAGARFYGQLATEASIKSIIQTQFPDAWKVLNEGEQNQKLLHQIVENMQNPANVSMDQIVRTVEDIQDSSKILLETMVSPKQLFKDLGFNPEHMNDLDLGSLVSKLLRDFDVHAPGSPFTPSQRLIKAVDEEIAELSDFARIKGSNAGFLPNPEFNTQALRLIRDELNQGDNTLFPADLDILDLDPEHLEKDIFTNLLTLWPRYFEEAKVKLAGEGNEPSAAQVKRAGVLASQAVWTIAKPLRAVEELKTYLKMQMQNPSLHEETTYGWVRKYTGLGFGLEDRKYGSSPIGGERVKIHETINEATPHIEDSPLSPSTWKSFDELTESAHIAKAYLPDQLYHTTTAGTEISKNAILKAGSGQFTKDALGGADSGTVSLTDSFEVAKNIKTTFLRLRELANADIRQTEELLLKWRDEDFKVLTEVERYNLEQLRSAGFFTQEIDAIKNPDTSSWAGLKVTVQDIDKDAALTFDAFNFDELAELGIEAQQVAKAKMMNLYLHNRDQLGTFIIHLRKNLDEGFSNERKIYTSATLRDKNGIVAAGAKLDTRSSGTQGAKGYDVGGQVWAKEDRLYSLMNPYITAWQESNRADTEDMVKAFNEKVAMYMIGMGKKKASDFDIVHIKRALIPDTAAINVNKGENLREYQVHSDIPVGNPENRRLQFWKEYQGADREILESPMRKYADQHTEGGFIPFMPETANEDFVKSVKQDEERLTLENIMTLLRKAAEPLEESKEQGVVGAGVSDAIRKTMNEDRAKEHRSRSKRVLKYIQQITTSAQRNARSVNVPSERAAIKQVQSNLATRIQGIKKDLNTGKMREDAKNAVLDITLTDILLRQYDIAGPNSVKGTMNTSHSSIVLNPENILTTYFTPAQRKLFTARDIELALLRQIEEGRAIKVDVVSDFQKAGLEVSPSVRIWKNAEDAFLPKVGTTPSFTNADGSPQTATEAGAWWERAQDEKFWLNESTEGQREYRRVVNNDTRTDLEVAADDFAKFGDPAKALEVPYDIADTAGQQVWNSETTPALQKMWTELGEDLAWMANEATKATLSKKTLADDVLTFEKKVNEQMTIAIKEALEGLEGLGKGEQSIRARGKGLIDELTGQLEVKVNELVNSTKADDGFDGYNTILKKLGIDDAREVTLGKLGADGERSMTRADALGKNVWHDDDNDVFSNWLTNTAPKLAFLRKFREKAMEEITEGVPEGSASERFINTIRAFDIQQANRHSGMHLDTELDEKELARAADDIIYLREGKKRATPELASAELRPDEGIHVRGLPRYNTWQDFLKFNFSENLETNVAMSYVLGNQNHSDESKTFALATRTLLTPRGKTEDAAKSTILSPATRALDTQGGTRTAGVNLTDEERVLYNARTGRETESGELVKWYLPNGKKNMEFDEKSNVLPANYGMPIHRRDDNVLVESGAPQGVHGRVFMQQTPQAIKKHRITGEETVVEYVAVITDDSWPVEARRMAIFIKKGATEAEIEKEVMALAAYTAKTGKRRKAIGIDFRMSSRGEYNWTGFRTSWSGSAGGTGLMDPATAQAEMKRIIDMIDELGDPTEKKGLYQKFIKARRTKGATLEEAERERGIERRTLINVVNYMQEQWEKGWPIYGTTKDSLESILPLFKREQMIFENSRRQVVDRGLRAGLQDAPISPVSGLPVANKPEVFRTVQSLSKEEGDTLITALKGMESETNKMRKTAGQFARAQADWILHDYNNTNNLDYILRWIGPWHIWQTRTTGKLAVTLMDNPALVNRIPAFQQAMTQINQENDVGQYQITDIPVGQMIQPFYGMAKATGIPSPFVDAVERKVDTVLPKEATMNINAFLFWNDMFDYFPSGGRTSRETGDPTLAGEDPLAGWEEFGFFGKAADIWSGVFNLPVSPLYTAGLTISGQFGDRNVDKLEKIVGGLTRPADMILGLTASLFGRHTKTQVIRTNRDLREIDWMYFNMAMQEVIANGPHIEKNPKLKATLMAYDMWSRKKNDPLVNVPLLSVLGLSSGKLFVNELSGNDPAVDPITGDKLDSVALQEIHTLAVSSAANRRAQRDGWSMMVGMAVNVPYPTVIDPKTGYKVDAGDIMGRYYDIVQDRSLSTKQKTKAYDDLFNNHPYVRNYLNNKKFESAPIKTAQATSMFYSGLDAANIRYAEDLAAIPDRVPVPSSPVDARNSLDEETKMTDEPMDNFEFFSLRAIAAERRRVTTQALKLRIFDATGVNTGVEGDEYGEVHNAFAIDKRSFGDVSLFRQMHSENLFNNEMFMTIFADNPMAGVQRIEDVLDTLFPDGSYKAVTREQVEEIIDQFAKEKLDRRDAPYPREYITVDMFNAWQLESYVQMLRKDKLTQVPEMFSDEFKDLYSIRGTNAANWSEYYADLDTWETNLKADDPEAFEAFSIYEASTADMNYIVDKAIENIMRERQTLVQQAYELGRGDAMATANQVQFIEDTWNKPTVDDVMTWLETNKYGNVWLSQNEYNENDLVAHIKKRIHTVDDITFEDMRDGKFEEKIAKLGTQLNLEVPFKEQYHFLSPNKERTIHNGETLDEFTEAYAVYRLLDFSKENNINMYLNPTDIPSHALYYEYFVNGSDTKKVQAAALGQLYKDGEFEQAAILKEKLRQGNTSGFPIGAVAPLPVVNPTGEGMPPAAAVIDEKGFSVTEGGFPSSGASAFNIKRNYQIWDLGQHPSLSNEGRKIKSYHTSRYYETNQEVPGDFIFEHFGRNNVASRDDIIDMWESMYPEMSKLYGNALLSPAVRTLLGMTDVNGKAGKDASIATYWYIDALADMVASATGIKSINRRPVRTVVQTKKTSIPSSASSRVTTPSTSGAGGLPTWAEATRHMTMVFHDNELEQAVINFFINPSKSLSNNHQRMLRAMYRTFPIGSGYTFEQWLQALKLIYQTKMLVGGSSNNYQSSGRNQYFQYPSNTPRMARYRD